MIQIPKKALPATGSHERFLAFVIQSEEEIKDLKNDIGESTYSTATRGERLQPAARPVAEGVYAITGDPDGRTTHFAYLLTLPAHATVQTSNCGSFVVSTRVLPCQFSRVDNRTQQLRHLLKQEAYRMQIILKSIYVFT